MEIRRSTSDNHFTKTTDAMDGRATHRTAESGTPLLKFVRNPHQSERSEPRVVARRPKPFKRMVKPRAELRKAQLEPEPVA